MCPVEYFTHCFEIWFLCDHRDPDHNTYYMTFLVYIFMNIYKITKVSQIAINFSSISGINPLFLLRAIPLTTILAIKIN